MTGLFKLFRRNDSGMTSIEYAVLAGMMGTGVAISASYVADGLSTFVATQGGCTWETAEVDENGKSGGQKCVYGKGGWSARRPARTSQPES